MITVNNVTKKYGENSGNFSISFNVSDGEVFGIIGPNGAGKTTLIKQIIGLIKSDDGNILINNYKPIIDNQLIMKETGYLAGEISLFNNITGRKLLEYSKSLKENVDWELTLSLIDYFELVDIDKKIKKMSKGTKQKLAIICALMNKPKILILDEPTSGLDPVMQNLFNKLILKIKDEWKSTIIICSHILDEISMLCDNVGLLKNGIIVKNYDMTKTSLDILKKDFNQIFDKSIVV